VRIDAAQFTQREVDEHTEQEAGWTVDEEHRDGEGDEEVHDEPFGRNAPFDARPCHGDEQGAEEAMGRSGKEGIILAANH